MKKNYIKPSVELIVMPEIMAQVASYHNLGDGEDGGFVVEIGDGGEEIDDCAKGNFWEDDEYWVGL